MNGFSGALVRMSYPLKLKDQNFQLHASGAVFWKEKSCLLISDVHLGKVTHFRKFGAALPRHAVHKNYLLLDRLVSYYQPFEICFLGDLFHSSLNKEWVLFENWMARTPSKITLITGNHDIIAPEKFESLGVEQFEELTTENFLLTHHPETRNGYYNLCGHIHPAVRLQGAGRQRLKLPCFFKTEDQMILPAFGEFTGSYTLKPSDKDEVYVIAGEEVIKV
ncbi:ligase-associated DNA damage response endonuclease PdeM [Euzebyella marina]|nr:ligase-associated DNA damage response endonuclease PdeM [Euzebyella marina]